MCRGNALHGQAFAVCLPGCTRQAQSGAVLGQAEGERRLGKHIDESIVPVLGMFGGRLGKQLTSPITKKSPEDKMGEWKTQS